MTVCMKCHRPLKRPTESGFGPVCAKTIQPVPSVEPDLFGYDLEAAAQAARARLGEFIAFQAWQAHREVSDGFLDARKRLIWVVRP